MDDDTDLVAQVAAELVRQMGERAVTYAIDQADIGWVLVTPLPHWFGSRSRTPPLISSRSGTDRSRWESPPPDQIGQPA